MILYPFASGVCRKLFNVMEKNTQEPHITTIKEVKTFFRHIAYDLDINFHPDDDFKDYVSYKAGERTMDDEQVELYNCLMDEAFKHCDDDQVYEIGRGNLWKNRGQN